MAVSPTSAASQVSSISLQDFLKILTSQLSNQDPLKPLDNQEFVTQIAQFSTLEQSAELNQKIDQLLSVQSVTQSVGLLGKNVDINTSTSSSGLTLSGQVTSINYVSGVPHLTVNVTGGGQQDVTLGQILAVHNP
jgi:flagellar basal-body rod modification protein FlgD